MISLGGQLMNSSDPFQLLTKPKYSCIEKIKTVSSTYMAAAGLNDGDGDDKVGLVLDAYDMQRA